MGIKTLVLITAIFLLGSSGYSIEPKEFLRSGTVSGKAFHYLAKRFGIPILKASIKIENGIREQGGPTYQIRASVDSLDYLKFLFRMNNRFLSTIEAESLVPLRYIKEIHQEGLLTKKKNYLQTLTFDHFSKKLIVEKPKEGERKEIPLSTETYDPLSIFAKYYLKNELHPGQDIQMSIFDGIKMRHMIFYAKKEKVRSKIYGEVEAVCLESTTSFSSFEDKEGKIRIWYASDREKIPIMIELDLPIGDIKFELESVEQN